MTQDREANMFTNRRCLIYRGTAVANPEDFRTRMVCAVSYHTQMQICLRDDSHYEVSSYTAHRACAPQQWGRPPHRWLFASKIRGSPPLLRRLNLIISHRAFSSRGNNCIFLRPRVVHMPEILNARVQNHPNGPLHEGEH